MENNEDQEGLTPPLTWREIAMRDKFVREYLTDYNALSAAIRCGYHSSYAKEYAVKFMTEPYVLQKIAQEENSVEFEPDEAAMKKKILAGLLREAHNTGPGSTQSARVAALSKLASMHGMDAPIRTKQELTGPNGEPLGEGVFIIPGVMTPEDWEKAAAAQQAALTSPDTPTQH